jgi:hypothetical protein
LLDYILFALLHLDLGNNIDIFARFLGEEATFDVWICCVKSIVLDLNSFILIKHQLITDCVY